jgi:hypothetical protein
VLARQWKVANSRRSPGFHLQASPNGWHDVGGIYLGRTEVEPASGAGFTRDGRWPAGATSVKSFSPMLTKA